MPFGVRHTQPEDCIWRTSADIIIGSEMLRFAIFFFVYIPQSGVTVATSTGYKMARKDLGHLH